MEKSELILNGFYTHYKKGGAYILIAISSDILSQYEGEWYPTVTYRPHDKDRPCYHRTTKEFLEKFELTGYPLTEPFKIQEVCGRMI